MVKLSACGPLAGGYRLPTRQRAAHGFRGKELLRVPGSSEASRLKKVRLIEPTLTSTDDTSVAALGFNADNWSGPSRAAAE